MPFTYDLNGICIYYLYHFLHSNKNHVAINMRGENNEFSDLGWYFTAEGEIIDSYTMDTIENKIGELIDDYSLEMDIEEDYK